MRVEEDVLSVSLCEADYLALLIGDARRWSNEWLIHPLFGALDLAQELLK